MGSDLWCTKRRKGCLHNTEVVRCIWNGGHDYPAYGSNLLWDFFAGHCRGGTCSTSESTVKTRQPHTTVGVAQGQSCDTKHDSMGTDCVTMLEMRTGGMAERVCRSYLMRTGCQRTCCNLLQSMSV